MITALPLIDPLPVWIAAAALATLFAHAALAKFTDRALLEQHLSVYGTPTRLLPLATRALPLLEAAIAALLLSPWRTLGAGLAFALLLGYAATMAWHRFHGHELDCGCGGEPLPVSWALVARNCALAGLALVAGSALAPRALGLADFAVLAAALPLAALLYAAFNQVLRHRQRGRSGQLFGRT